MWRAGVGSLGSFLMIYGNRDTMAPPEKQAWTHYRKMGATKLIFEVTGGDHYVANGPAGGAESGDTQGDEIQTALGMINGMISVTCANCAARIHSGVPGRAHMEL